MVIFKPDPLMKSLLSYPLCILPLSLLILLLAGCQEDGVKSEVDSKLSILIWTEYLSPSVLDGFVKDSGAQISVTEVSNSAELKQALASEPDNFDIVVADEKTLNELISLRLLREIDREALGSASQSYESFLDSAVSGNSRYMVPYLWGLTVLAGRSEVVRDLEPSWTLLWREDLSISLLDEPADLMWMALLAEGHDPAAATAEQIKAAAEKLGKRFPNFSESMKDQPTVLEELKSGEVDLVMTYNGDALQLAREVPGIEVFVPKEGSPLWLDSFSISRDAPNVRLAHLFIDYMSRPEISALSASELQYASPNRASLSLVDKSLLENNALYPSAETLGKCRAVNFPPETEKQVGQAMLSLITKSRSRYLPESASSGTTAIHRREESID